MLVHLTRPIRGDDEYRKLSEALLIVAFHSTTSSPNHALAIEVDAESRSDAERVAFDMVVAVVGADNIDRVTGEDDTMQDRQVMFWLLATRQHVRSWEVHVADYIRSQFTSEDRPRSLVWAAQLGHHMALVACHNLVRALDNAEARYTQMPEEMEREIQVLRNLHEHWDEQWPAFYNVDNPGPLKRSGQEFNDMYPRRSPYWALGWSNTDGPRLGPGLTAGAMHAYLDLLETEVTASAPDLAQYATPIAPSPWIGPTFGRDQWWPGPIE